MPLVQGCLWAQMRSFDHIETHPGGREEVLDDISEDFPYLSVLSQHDRYHERTAPWHWHQELELFYVLEGTVDYATPHERLTLPEGSVGMVNANVLHMTHATDGAPDVNLLIHMFRPQFLAERGSRVWRRCVEPLISATSIELLVVTPGEGDRAGVRDRMYRAFETAVGEGDGWELRLRDYRIQQSCRMLAHTTRPIAAVGEMSGLGAASHFGQVFRAAMGCTPREYRSRWQD